MKKLLNPQPSVDIEIKETSTRDIAIKGIDVVSFEVVGWVFFNESNYSVLEKSIMQFMSHSPVRCPSATSLRLIRS